MTIIDTHQHLWEPQQFSYPWLDGIAELNAAFTIGDYARASAGTDIVKTVFVECDIEESQILAEAQHIQKLADQYPLIAGIVAGSRPERFDFPHYLDQLLLLSKLRGIRRVLHTMPDKLSQSQLFTDNLRRLSGYSLSFDLCVLARQLPLALALVQRCPEVSFILDHCGIPDVRNLPLEPWRNDIRLLSQLPNVACKISGIAAYGNGKEWANDDLRPFVEHVIECFGWDRVLFGTDWPVCNLGGDLRRWVDAALFLTKDASPACREQLFSLNAERVYRLADA